MKFFLLFIVIMFGIFFNVESFAIINVVTHPTSAFDKVHIGPNAGPLNKQLGQLFLAKNKLIRDVNTLDSGLQFKIIRNGIGQRPTLADRISIVYAGRYMSGTIFDSKEPKNGIMVRVASLVPGIQQALQLMDVGSIWEIYLPANLGHGERGVPGVIGPNQLVIYNVQLLAIPGP